MPTVYQTNRIEKAKKKAALKQNKKPIVEKPIKVLSMNGKIIKIINP